MESAKKSLIIVGAGKFGREVLTWAEQAIAAGTPWQIKGFLDDRPDILAGFNCGVPILCSAEAYTPDPQDILICAIGEPSLKRRYSALLELKGARFGTLIHPTALIGRRVAIGHGSIVGPFTQLSCDIQIGNHVFIGTFSAAGHDTRIGDWCQISGHCGLNGNAFLEDGVFLGSHSCILPQARIGEWAYVGAGSVVIRRVRARTKVFGNPAIVIGAVDVVPREG